MSKKDSAATLNSGVLLWNKAKQLIPGGNQLLSKRAEMFLPDFWPAYYQKAKGVEVWDLDNNHYYDMSIMGIGSCVLGYANDEVNRAVQEAIEAGSMCTLNCYEEVALAEKLIALHPWSQMTRFARTGGEACSIAIRVARAASGKDKVAFCGYHGWSDWYLSANLADAKHLDHQLLPGLSPAGVPRNLKDTAFPFSYGDLKSLEKIVEDHHHELGVIIMEFQRSKDLDLEFLKGVRQIATREKAILVFDEITSGFRLRTGGMHLLYGIEPDLLVLGKALGNGFPISAVIGRKDIMQAAQGTFISSTYWTERIGPVAALETLRQFEEKRVIDTTVRTGETIENGLKKIFSKYDLRMGISGLKSYLVMTSEEENPLLIKTLFTQEMMKRGFLASTVIFVSSAHTPEIVVHYLSNAEEVFEKIAEWKRKGELEARLLGPVCHSGFQRLT